MADRPTASTSRVGRPGTRSTHQTSCVPKDSKPRMKSAHASPSKASKIKDPSKSLSKGEKSAKAPSVKANLVLVVDSEEEQAVIEGVDTTQPDQLPDLHPVEQIFINQPNPQQILPLQQPDQPNQLIFVPNQQNQLNNQENNQNLLPNQMKNLEKPTHSNGRTIKLVIF